MQDGLGSLRGVADHSAAVLWSGSPAPYGGYFDETGTRQTHYGFTGEPTDSNGLPYLRARYYDPAAGVFMALDPFEGTFNRPMSLNGYSWVEGNTPNATDPSGTISVNDAYRELNEIIGICQQPPEESTACKRLLGEICNTLINCAIPTN